MSEYDERMEKIAATNLEEPIKEVMHGQLTRSSDSSWKSVCPVCLEGVLLVRRHNDSLELVEFDNCILCGQRVRYLDIDEMRMMDFAGD